MYGVLLNVVGLKEEIHLICTARTKCYSSPAGVIAVRIIPMPRSLVTSLTRALLSYLQFK